jgi:2-hydroxy-3-keto-5-methylthiopentenyl-1-phosphate phosphatase
VPLVEKVLGPHRHRLEQLVAATVQPHPNPNQGLEFHSPFRSSEELVAKAEVMERYGQGLRVVIGDSITDLRMAEAADLVFARAPLCDWLDRRGIAYHRWDDFDDVAAVLRAEGLLPAVVA